MDRAAGALVGMASGDALGAGYEFGGPLPDGAVVDMIGGGAFNWDRGEWTDDTSMAVPILRELAAGEGLDDEATLGRIAGEWQTWAATAKDVGSQTRQVMSLMSEHTEVAARQAALAVHTRSGRSGGNGSLMRTAPVALGYLDDPEGLALAARRISDLTHFDEDAGDACVLWSLAIRAAIVEGRLVIREGLEFLRPERRARWAALLDEAEREHPRDFENNGWVVEALQGAWSAITNGDSLVDVLERAVRGGRDTDTVAAIAGGLAGAFYGVSAVPTRWQRELHGWPGLRYADLVELPTLAVRGGVPTAAIDYTSYGDITSLARHPFDEGVWLGGVGILSSLPSDVDAVVSLCRVAGTPSGISPADHVQVWLIDQVQPSANPHLDFVLAEAADAVAALRAEGKTVLLHCAQGMSRTPAVGAVYAVRHLGVSPVDALAAVEGALPLGNVNAAFRAAVLGLSIADTVDDRVRGDREEP
ncbi:ADP-ribosylglycohydrolase family protein [Frondihabitans sp. PhB188]|uniref:ADP-ribosylglycohydrolase family protein n=1 Tax=Frondihabitans sp. PhB188 TaxID=2485200 RepID=UPI0021017885|nr:ADP-ribosylglycohydrolase family protein [Frondihabitans sp. PhB188]